MERLLRWLLVAVLVLSPATTALAEKVQDLPAPAGYVNDFAHVLSPETRQSVEDLCTQVDRQAHAQIAVVTIKTLDEGDTVETFTTALEDKWKVGTKGTDRGVLMLFVMSPRKGRIEIGYGLEGILNDAKVGDIGRSMVPYAQQEDYDHAIPLGVQGISQVIAADAGVTITPIVHQYHRQQTQSAGAPLSMGRLILYGILGIFVLILLVRGGGSGLLFFLLGNLMGGGGFGGGGRGGGGGRDDDNSGGGFGGFDGGSSGGGGASGDW